MMNEHLKQSPRNYSGTNDCMNKYPPSPPATDTSNVLEMALNEQQTKLISSIPINKIICSKLTQALKIVMFQEFL